jgi:uncharacterized membrane protein
MRSLITFVRTTLLGGLLFLLPVVLIIYLLGKAFSLAATVLRPVSRLAPSDELVGIAVTDALVILALILLCFLAGLIAGTGLGASLRGVAEKAVLRHLPGYTLYKAAAGEPLGLPGNDDEVSVALARLDDAWLLAFVLERHDSGLLTVFVPSAPAAAAGSIYYLTEEQVRRLNVPIKDAMQCVMQLGVGSKALLASLPKAG